MGPAAAVPAGRHLAPCGGRQRGGGDRWLGHCRWKGKRERKKRWRIQRKRERDRETKRGDEHVMTNCNEQVTRWHIYTLDFWDFLAQLNSCILKRPSISVLCLSSNKPLDMVKTCQNHGLLLHEEANNCYCRYYLLLSLLTGHVFLLQTRHLSMKGWSESMPCWGQACLCFQHGSHDWFMLTWWIRS